MTTNWHNDIALNSAGNDYARVCRLKKKGKAANKKRKARLREWSVAIDKQRQFLHQEMTAALEKAEEMSLLSQKLNEMKAQAAATRFAMAVEDSDMESASGSEESEE